MLPAAREASRPAGPAVWCSGDQSTRWPWGRGEPRKCPRSCCRRSFELASPRGKSCHRLWWKLPEGLTVAFSSAPPLSWAPVSAGGSRPRPCQLGCVAVCAGSVSPRGAGPAPVGPRVLEMLFIWKLQPRGGLNPSTQEPRPGMQTSDLQCRAATTATASVTQASRGRPARHPRASRASPSPL